MDGLDDNDPLRIWYRHHTESYGYRRDYVPEYLRTQTDTSSRGKRGKCVLLLISLSHIYQLVTESICQLVLPHIQRPQSSSFLVISPENMAMYRSFPTKEREGRGSGGAWFSVARPSLPSRPMEQLHVMSLPHGNLFCGW